MNQQRKKEERKKKKENALLKVDVGIELSYLLMLIEDFNQGYLSVCSNVDEVSNKGNYNIVMYHIMTF